MRAKGPQVSLNVFPCDTQRVGSVHSSSDLLRGGWAVCTLNSVGPKFLCTGGGQRGFINAAEYSLQHAKGQVGCASKGATGKSECNSL